ncbi:polysaccharide pyruvyl transferase family protein [Paenibacillus sp. BAC0078]
MKKILITPGITDLNRGDQALIWLIKNLVEEAGIDSHYKLLQSGNNDADIYNQSKQSVEMGFDVMKPILLHPARGKEKKTISYTKFTKLSWGTTAVIDIFKSALLLSNLSFLVKLGTNLLDKSQRGTYEEFKKMDLMIVKGGGFLHTYKRITDLYYLYYSLYNLMLAKRLGKKIIIMPNSYGPFMGKIEKKIVRRVLRNCKLIYARESISEKYLTDIIDNEVATSVDLGFYIKDYKDYQIRKVIEFDFPEKKIAITMRPYRFPESENGKEKYKNYIEEMTKVVKELIYKNYHPIFVAHTLGPSTHEDDRIAIEEVIKLLESNGIENNTYSYINESEMNCFDITELYSQMDYIIGTRFHSVIFAMTSLIPAIAVSYSGHKTFGIMSDMGLSDYTVDIGNIKAEDVLRKLNQLFKNESEVKDKIKKYLEISQKDKRNLIEKLRTNLK